NGRLQDVVTAVVHETSADEDDGGDLVDLRQLADRVEHDDVGARFRVDWKLGSPRGHEPGVASQMLDLAEAFRLPRRKDRQGARHRRLAACEGAKDGRLLAARGAAGDDDDTMARDAEEPEHAIARLAVSDGRREIERIELQAPGDRHAGRVGPEIDEASRRFL